MLFYCYNEKNNSVFQGKVSTPRIEPRPTRNEVNQSETAARMYPSVNDEKKAFFGFDESTDDDCDASAMDRGCVTLSDISPVKRSSMLPPSHYLTLLGSPSISTLSVTSDFAKPLSAR